MPIPLSALNDNDFEVWYNKNRELATSHNWSKDVAKNVYMRKAAFDNGYLKSTSAIGNEMENALLKSMLWNKNLGKKQENIPGPVQIQPAQALPQMADTIQEEQDYSQPITQDAPVQFAPFNNAPDEDSETQPFQYGDYISPHNRRNTKPIGYEIMDKTQQEAEQYNTFFKQNPAKRNEVKKMLREMLSSNGYYNAGKDKGWYDDNDEWWDEVTSNFCAIANSSSDDAAQKYLEAQVRQHAIEKQTNGQAWAKTFRAWATMTTAGLLGDVGAFYGPIKGFLNVVVPDEYEKNLNAFERYEVGKFDNELNQLANKILQQGTVRTQDDFNPETDISEAFMSPEHWWPNAVAQGGFTLASLITGRLATAAGKFGMKQLGKLAYKIAKSSKKVSKLLPQRLPGETREQFRKRLQQIKKRNETMQKAGGIYMNAQNAGGEAGIDATEQFDNTLDFGTDVADALVENQTEHDFSEYLGGRNVEEVINEETNRRIRDIVSNNPDVQITDGLWKTVHDQVALELNTKRAEFKQKAIDDHQADYANAYAVAARTGINTYVAEKALLMATDFAVDKAMHPESFKNAKRQAGAKPLFFPNFKVEWDEAAKKATSKKLSKLGITARAVGKALTEATVGEVLPENAQNFISAYNEAVGRNAIEQFISATTNGDNPEIGDLYYGEGAMQKGIEAGWKETKANFKNTSGTTLLSTVFGIHPNLNNGVHFLKHEGESGLEYASRIINNPILANIAEMDAMQKRSDFYKDEINNILVTNPGLAGILQSTLTLENYQDMMNKALATGDMAKAQETQMGQIVTLFMDMNHAGLESPLSVITENLNKIKDATVDSEEGQEIINHTLAQDEERQNKYESLTEEEKAKENEKILAEQKRNAEKLLNIKQKVAEATEDIHKNYASYDENIQNALIHGKVFNDVFGEDVETLRHLLEHQVMPSSSQSQTPSEEGTLTPEDLSKLKAVGHLEQLRQEQAEEEARLAQLENEYDKGETVEEKVANNAKLLESIREKNPQINENNLEEFQGKLKKALKESIKKRKKEIAKAEKKVKEDVTGKKINVSMNDLLNGDPDVRSFLLNENNWNLIPSETKKQLESLMAEGKKKSAGFDKDAKDLANLDRIMKENEDAYSAYLTDPNSLRPIYQRVMRLKRHAEYDKTVASLNSVQNQHDFDEMYARETEFDTEAFQSIRNGRKRFMASMKGQERKTYIDEKLQGNKFYDSYVSKKQLKGTINAMNLENARLEAQKNPQNQVDITKKYWKNHYVFKFLNSLNVDLQSVNAVKEALSRKLDGHTMEEGGSLDNTEYSKFVQDNRAKDAATDESGVLENYSDEDLTYSTLNDAVSAVTELVDGATQRIKAKEEATKPSTAEMADKDVAAPPAPKPTPSSLYDSLEPDNEKYNEEVTDSELNFDPKVPQSLHDAALNLARKMAYNFRLSDGQIKVIANKLESFIRVYDSVDNNKKEEEMNFLHEFIENMHAHFMDKQKSTFDNFIFALEKSMSLFKTNLQWHQSVMKSVAQDLLKSCEQSTRYFINREDANHETIIKNLSSTSVETSNLTTANNSSNESARNEALLEWASEHGMTDSLNTQANMLHTLAVKRRATAIRIFSDESLDSKIEANMNAAHEDNKGTDDEKKYPKYNETNHRALILGAVIPEKNVATLDADVKKRLVTRKTLEGNTLYLLPIGFLPASSENGYAKINEWRNNNAFIPQNKDMVSNQVLYIPRNGFKFSHVTGDGSNMKPLKDVKKLSPNFRTLRAHHLDIFKGHKKELDAKGNPIPFRQLGIKEGASGSEFTIYVSPNQKFENTKGEKGIPIFIAPMQQTYFVGDSTLCPQGTSLQQILKNPAKEGAQMLRMMHYKKAEQVSDPTMYQEADRYGRMGYYMYRVREYLLNLAQHTTSKDTTDPNDITEIIGSGNKASITEDQDRFAYQVFRLSAGDIRVDQLADGGYEFFLTGVGEAKFLARITGDQIAGFATMDKEDINMKNVTETMDQFAFELLKNLVLDRNGNVATQQTYGLTDQIANSEDSFVHWNLYYGTANSIAELANIRQTRTDATDESINEEKRNEAKQKLKRLDSAKQILEDFYDAGLLMIKDNIENFFVTDDSSAGSDNPLYDYNDNGTSSIQQQKNKKGVDPDAPQIVKEIVSNSEKVERLAAANGHTYITDDNNNQASVTSMTQLINPSIDEFDPDSPWAPISSCVGNQIDALCKEIFAGDSNSSNLTRDNNGKITLANGTKPLTSLCPNFDEETLQILATQLLAERERYVSQGYTFIPFEITLSGTVTLIGNDGKYIDYPIIGKPDLVAYAPDGRIVIIDIKTKHTNNASEQSFWDSSKDNEQNKNTENGKKLKQYTAQISLYADCIEQTHQALSPVIAETCILEIPVLYENPTTMFDIGSKGYVSYSIVGVNGQKVAQISKNDIVSQAKVGIGTIKTHARTRLDLSNSISAYDKYQVIVDKLTKIRKQEKELQDKKTSTDPSNKNELAVINYDIKRCQSNIKKYEKFEKELREKWLNNTGEDITKHPGNIGEVASVVSGNKKLDAIIPSESTALNVRLESISHNVPRSVSDIFDFSENSGDAQLIAQLGIDKDYWCTVKPLPKNRATNGAKYFVDTFNHSLVFSPEFIIELNELYPNLPPSDVAAQIKCHM